MIRPPGGRVKSGARDSRWGPSPASFSAGRQGTCGAPSREPLLRRALPLRGMPSDWARSRDRGSSRAQLGAAESRGRRGRRGAGSLAAGRAAGCARGTSPAERTSATAQTSTLPRARPRAPSAPSLLRRNRTATRAASTVSYSPAGASSRRNSPSSAPSQATPATQLARRDCGQDWSASGAIVAQYWRANGLSGTQHVPLRHNVAQWWRNCGAFEPRQPA